MLVKGKKTIHRCDKCGNLLYLRKGDEMYRIPLTKLELCVFCCYSLAKHAQEFCDAKWVFAHVNQKTTTKISIKWLDNNKELQIMTKDEGGVTVQDVNGDALTIVPQSSNTFLIQI